MKTANIGITEVEDMSIADVTALLPSQTPGAKGAENRDEDAVTLWMDDVRFESEEKLSAAADKTK